MSRLGRYWLFFVIVAVGLALSWGQVGRKTERVLQQQSTVYLVAEATCSPRQNPCAAVATDRALVLGPAGNGLALKQAGFETSRIVRIEATFYGAGEEPLSRTTIDPRTEHWLLDDVSSAAGMVRISVVGNAMLTVAEFPL